MQLPCEGEENSRRSLPTALMPKSLEGRGAALSWAVSRLPMSPEGQTSKKGDDDLGALVSGCEEGMYFVKGPIFPV